MRTVTLAARFQLLFGRNTYLFFNYGIGNLVWETNEGVGRKNYFVLVIWEALNVDG